MPLAPRRAQEDTKRMTRARERGLLDLLGFSLSGAAAGASRRNVFGQIATCDRALAGPNDRGTPTIHADFLEQRCEMIAHRVLRQAENAAHLRIAAAFTYE